MRKLNWVIVTDTQSHGQTLLVVKLLSLLNIIIFGENGGDDGGKVDGNGEMIDFKQCVGFC